MWRWTCWPVWRGGLLWKRQWWAYSDGGSELRNAKYRGKDLLESPETFLTKMCIVASASEAVELMLEMLEMLSERRIMMGGGAGGAGGAGWC